MIATIAAPCDAARVPNRGGLFPQRFDRPVRQHGAHFIGRGAAVHRETD